MKLDYLYELRTLGHGVNEIEALISGLVEFATFVESYAKQAFDNDDFAKAIHLTTNFRTTSRQKATGDAEKYYRRKYPLFDTQAVSFRKGVGWLHKLAQLCLGEEFAAPTIIFSRYTMNLGLALSPYIIHDELLALIRAYTEAEQRVEQLAVNLDRGYVVIQVGGKVWKLQVGAVVQAPES